MASEFIAYIDEAGDEGFGKIKRQAQSGGQSSWLIIGAMIVRAESDPSVPMWKRSICSKFPNMQSKDLHWSKLNHDQRAVVSADISALPLYAAMTLSHKVTIPGSTHATTFKQPGYLYNYLTRWLLERLIDWCRKEAEPNPASLRLVFSKRGGTNYKDMKKYLRKLSRGNELYKAPRTTDWSVLDINGIEVENHSKRAGLQLADCITSSFFTALEHNRYGNTEHSYAHRLIGNLITGKVGNVNGAGLTVVPGLNSAEPDERQLLFLKQCWSGWVPGP